MLTTGRAAIAQPASVEDFLGQWAKAWNEHDAEAVAALCAEDLVYDEPALGDTVHGRGAIRGWVAAMHTDFPDHKFSLEGLYAEVGRPAVLVAWKFTGTHATTGRRIEFHGDDRVEFDQDGLISAYRCLYDNDLVLRQLGETSSR